MHSLKDNNRAVYKIFFKGSFIIRCTMIEIVQDCHPIYVATKQVIMRSFKSAGQKNEVQFLKNLREEYDLSLYPLA